MISNMHVCSNANPLHYYAASGIRAGRIDGIECGLFSIHAPLGQIYYLWHEYPYSVLEKVEVRVTVSITVCVVLLCCMG